MRARHAVVALLLMTDVTALAETVHCFTTAEACHEQAHSPHDTCVPYIRM